MSSYTTLIIIGIFIFICWFYSKHKENGFVNFKTWNCFITYNIIIALITISFCYANVEEKTSKYINDYQVAVENLKNDTATDRELDDIASTFFIIDSKVYRGSIGSENVEYIEEKCPNAKELYYFTCFKKEYRISPDNPMCKFYLDKIPDDYDGVLSEEILLEKNIYKAEDIIKKNEKFLKDIS